jgi:hypothetical protein
VCLKLTGKYQAWLGVINTVKHASFLLITAAKSGKLLFPESTSSKKAFFFFTDSEEK